MPQLVWDKVGERVHETGLDRGVLYLPDGSAVAWNGLTSVIEHITNESTPVYFDGRKVNQLVVLGDFEASMKAITYPEEFAEFEAVGSTKPGISYGDQPPKMFGLCYRVQVGDDLSGPASAHKIHLIYNVIAVPKDKTYATLKNDPSLVEFEWDLAAIPEEIDGFRPTAHFVIDSRDVDPWLFQELEEMLYGSSTAEAALIPMQDLLTYLNTWFRIQIIDNGDGTWTAISRRDELIQFGLEGFFTIFQANAIFLDEFTYEISDTETIADVPQIKFVDNGDGTWTAVTDQDSLFSITGTGDEQEFQITNAEAVFVNADEWRVEDTPT